MSYIPSKLIYLKLWIIIKKTGNRNRIQDEPDDNLVDKDFKYFKYYIKYDKQK